ncbi:MAG TPA: hypothetical protein PKY12_05470 [Catalimonadaceae bacterium]|nr:hypothetical protein [Catalimonadaceae bacterium]
MRLFHFIRFALLVILLLGQLQPVFAQKPVSKTEDNLNEKNPKPPNRKIKKIKKNQQKLANDQSGNTVELPYRKALMHRNSEILKMYQPQDVKNPVDQKKSTEAQNERITQEQKGNVDIQKRLKFEKSQNKPITKESGGRTPPKKQQIELMRQKSEAISESKPTGTESRKSQRKRARALSAKTSQDQRGNTVTHVDKMYNIRLKSFQNSGYQPGITDHPLTQKEVKIRANYAITQEAGTSHTPDYAKREMRKRKSEQASSFEPQQVFSREKKRQMAEAKNKQLSEYGDGITMPKENQKELVRAKSKEIKDFTKGNTISREAHKDIMKEKSGDLANLKVGNTVNRKDYKEFLKKQSKTFSESEKGNTLSRIAHRDMMKKKNEQISTSTRGNTISREAQREMMKSKSSKIADFEPKIVLTREEKLKIMKRKSQAIENFEAGYLNTAAERKARIRKFFFPGQYQASTPQEKLKRMRSKSDEIARYEGKIKERKYQSNMHPSARHLGKFSLASMDDRADFRERTARKVNRDSRGNLPSYLKDKPQTPRYDRKTESGIWEKTRNY